MIPALVTLNWLLPLTYLALLVDYGATFALRLRLQVRDRWLGLGVLVHGLYLGLVGWHGGWETLTGPYMVLSVLAFFMAAVYLVIETATHDRRTGVFVLLLVFLFQYTSSMFFARAAAEFAEGVAAASLWYEIHVAAATLAYTALVFAGLYGLLHLLAARGLKLRQVGLLFDRLPPLDILRLMTWHAVLTGFVCMTVAIAAAALMTSFGAGAEPRHALGLKVLAKIVIGLVAWGVCGTAVLGKLVGHWPPVRTSGVTLAGSLLVLVLLTASTILS